MAVTSRGRTTEVQMPSKWRDNNRENTTSPERRKVWTEIKPTHYERKVSVVYYLCRSGSLEHPHFMEVPLSSNDGLFLRDVINRLNLLRGKGMATMYSWSSKRSYKNGFVWQDLSENDFIYPVHGQEYVLKGSELLDTPPLNNFESTTITTSSSTSSSIDKRLGEVEEEEECDFPVIVRRRNQSWSSIDLNEYKVYKPESNIELAGKGANASTQTDDKRRRIRRTVSSIDDINLKKISPHRIIEEDDEQNQTTELTREEISPPPSSSSPETLETLIKSHRYISQCTNSDQLSSPNDQNKHSGRIKASAVLMQLISCGTISCTTSATSSISPSDKSHHHHDGGGGGGGFSLISYYKSRLPRGGTGSSGGGSNQMSSMSSSNVVDCLMENPSFEKITLEDKEYFSGSLIETTNKIKDEFSVLKKSSSYNADRSAKLVLRDKEIDGVRAKCIPRKPKMSMHIRKPSSSSSNISMKSTTSNNNNNIISPSGSSNDLHLGTAGGGGSSSKRHSSGSSSSSVQ